MCATRTGESPESARRRALACLLVFAGVVCFSLNAFAPHYRVIDDAYISYRYARHLARGLGLVWNPGEPPVEGYTNFLLVLVEAPFLALGIEPVRVARAYALASTLGIAALLWSLTRGNGREPDRAAIAVLLFLSVPFLPKHALLGLETVTFSFHLMLVYWLLVAFVQAVGDRDASGRSPRWLLAACVASFVAGLSRPEGFAVCGAMLGLSLWIGARRAREMSLPSVDHRRLMLVAVVAFGLPTLAYQAWRYAYFGDLRPNSFHIKVASTGKGSLPGLGDFEAFVSAPAVAFLLLCTVLRRTWTRKDALLLPAALFPLFYLGSQHIMAFDHRFFVPYVPFLVLVATVALADGVLPTHGRVRWVNALLFAATFVFAFVLPSPAYGRLVHGRGGAPRRGEETHFMLGRLMATLPDRQHLRVVGPDAGAMPYFSETQWIDPIGLNDNFLARNLDAPKEALIDYLFGRNPDIWILCKAGKRFITSFPGPLGDQSARIHRDRRFARYVHVASYRKNSGGRYDYAFYVRRDLEEFSEVSRVLRSRTR